MADESVEAVLGEYIAAGLTRLAAIRMAIAEEKLEREADGGLAVRPKTRAPGRRLLGV